MYAIRIRAWERHTLPAPTDYGSAHLVSLRLLTDRKSKAYFLQLVAKQPEAKSCLFSLPVSCRYKTPSTGLLTANCRRPCQAIRSVAGQNWGAKGTPCRARPESDKPSASNPWGRPRHKSAESPASSFALLTIPFRSLVACSHAAIFVGCPESFPTLLIASLLI
jgi:hypothetical protein